MQPSIRTVHTVGPYWPTEKYHNLVQLLQTSRIERAKKNLSTIWTDTNDHQTSDNQNVDNFMNFQGERRMAVSDWRTMDHISKNNPLIHPPCAKSFADTNTTETGWSGRIVIKNMGRVKSALDELYQKAQNLSKGEQIRRQNMDETNKETAC